MWVPSPLPPWPRLEVTKGSKMRGKISGRYAAAVVAVVDQQFFTLLFHLDGDLLGFVPVVEAVVDGVEDRVRMNLGEAAGEGEDRQLGIALDIHLALGLLQLVAEGDHHLVQVVGEAEVVAGPDD